MTTLSKAAKEVFAANELRSGYLRPLVFYGTGSIGLNPAGAEVRLYDHLFTRPDPGAEGDVLDDLNPQALVVLDDCRLA